MTHNPYHLSANVWIIIVIISSFISYQQVSHKSKLLQLSQWKRWQRQQQRWWCSTERNMQKSQAIFALTCAPWTSILLTKIDRTFYRRHHHHHLHTLFFWNIIRFFSIVIHTHTPYIWIIRVLLSYFYLYSFRASIRQVLIHKCGGTEEETKKNRKGKKRRNTRRKKS